MQKDGDFLVRDSISQPGDFVLTCYWRGAPLHFVINRTEVRNKEGKIKIQYQFEENLFDRVSELIQFYISNKKAISEMSGAVIKQAVHRNVSMEKVDPKYAMAGAPKSCPMSPIMMNSGWYVHGHGHHGGTTSPRSGSPKPSPLVSPNTTPGHSPQMQRKNMGASDSSERHSSGSGRHSPSHGHSHGRHPVGRVGSMPTINPHHGHGGSPQMMRRGDPGRQMTIPHSCTCGGIAKQRSPERIGGQKSGIQNSPLPKPPSEPNIQNVPLPHAPSNGFIGNHDNLPARAPPHADTVLQEVNPKTLQVGNGQAVMRRPSPGPPPKPSRIPSIKKSSTDQRPVIPVRNPALYDDDGKDYSDYDQVKAWPSESAANSSILREPSPNAQNGTQSDTPKRPGSSLTRGRISNYANRNSKNNSSQDLETDGGDDYDNNFGAAETFNQGYDGADYDTPRSNSVIEVTRPDSGGVPRKSPSENKLNNNPSPPPPPNSTSNHSLSLDHLNDEDEQTTIAPTALPKRVITIPDLNSKQSNFQFLKFESGILPAENKPLEGSTMATIKQLLLESEPQMIAKHITKADLDSLKVSGFRDLGVGVFSGLELLTLPHGQQLRKDVIER